MDMDMAKRNGDRGRVVHVCIYFLCPSHPRSMCEPFRSPEVVFAV